MHPSKQGFFFGGGGVEFYNYNVNNRQSSKVKVKIRSAYNPILIRIIKKSLITKIVNPGTLRMD